MSSDPMPEVLDWVALYCPPSLRQELISALGAVHKSPDFSQAELWRALAETLVKAGQMDLAREALKRWQVVAPADHPLHAVLGGNPSLVQGDSDHPVAPPPPPPPASTRPPLPITKREEPTSRIVQVIDTTYTFHRLTPQVELTPQQEKALNKKITACWETYLDPMDKTSRVVLNEFSDKTYAPWAVSGVTTDFAGAAAVEIVVRTIQRHFVFSAKKDANTRKILTNYALPGTLIFGVLAGYLMGILK